MLIGLLGLRARYGDIIGPFVRNALLVGAIGDPLLVYGSWILDSGIGFYIPLLALAIGQLVLAIFGIAALKFTPLPQLNWLPLAAGAWYPVVYPLYLFVLLRIFYVYSEFSLTPAEVIDALVAAVLFAQAVAMVVLGFILQSDQPAVTDETAALS
jgi:hypothetical protein